MDRWPQRSLKYSLPGPVKGRSARFPKLEVGKPGFSCTTVHEPHDGDGQGIFVQLMLRFKRLSIVGLLSEVRHSHSMCDLGGNCPGREADGHDSPCYHSPKALVQYSAVVHGKVFGVVRGVRVQAGLVSRVGPLGKPNLDRGSSLALFGCEPGTPRGMSVFLVEASSRVDRAGIRKMHIRRPRSASRTGTDNSHQGMRPTLTQDYK